MSNTIVSTTSTTSTTFTTTNKKGVITHHTMHGPADSAVQSPAQRLSAGQIAIIGAVHAGAWSAVWSPLRALPRATLAGAVVTARDSVRAYHEAVAEKAESAQAAIAAIKAAGSVLVVTGKDVAPASVNTLEAMALMRAIAAIDSEVKGKAGIVRELARTACGALAELAAMPHASKDVKGFSAWMADQAQAGA